ncbi:cellulase-like family protein [Isoalcanivorax indicus]|uniref:cellulase-like family protein n=1 Tax=Isoalcanivorax indicus TaxID=2202653 RepID=UPI0013C402BD|nr:cellulase-like family protein [Isoalcanivorax indicus]
MSAPVLPGNQRLALACWDYSWLTRRDGRACEYRDLDRAFAGLAERGYNALRVDAVPHLLARGESGLISDRFEIYPEGLDLRRGARVPVQVQPRRLLPELLRRARDHGIQLWLSSWFVPDSQARRSFVRRPADFIRVWSETLNFIEQEGFADQVLAVDFCHEFPQAPCAHGAYRRIFSTHPMNPLPNLLSWSPAAARRVEEYLLEVPRALRALHPRILFGVSVAAGQESNLRQLDTSELDFMDHHVWLSDDPRFRLGSAEVLRHAPIALGERIQGRVAALLYRSRQSQWAERMRKRLHEQAEFGRVRRLLPMLGEGFVRQTHEQTLDWDWVRLVSEHTVMAALDEGMQVVSTGLHARPHSPGFWDDVAWHQRITAMIRNS